jgi:hypothetical protein
VITADQNSRSTRQEPRTNILTIRVEDMVIKRLMLREDAQAAVDRLLLAGQATGAIRMDATLQVGPRTDPS